MKFPNGHPAPRHNLELDLEKQGWSSGLPLANGLLGMMAWCSPDDLVVSLDRSDVWDTRPIPEYQAETYRFDRLVELVKTDRMDLVQVEFEAPYQRPAPTKLPVGRLRLPGASGQLHSGRLSLSEAIARITLDAGTLEMAALAGTGCGALWSTEPKIVEGIELEPPAFGEPAPPKEESFIAFIAQGRPQDLDYDKPELFTEGAIEGYVQKTYDAAFAAAILRKQEGDLHIAYVHVVSAETTQQAKDLVCEQLNSLAAQSLDDLLSAHREWWLDQWSRSWLALPDDAVREKWWVVDTYLLVAAAQPEAPPVALQGPWTVDAGYLPPWKGDYHHNLNTQMTYAPLYTAGRLDASRVMVDWLWETADNCREWTRRFFDKPGLCVPMTCDIENQQLGGWAPYTHSLTSGSWLVHNVWLDWRHGGDRELLKEKIAPWICDVAVFLEAIMEIDPQTGQRKPPIATSPEWNDNRREAFFWDWTNYDLALTRFTFFAAADVCEALGDGEEAERWRKALAECPDLLVGDDNSLLIAEGEPWNQPHRHFSNSLSIMPLHQLDPLDTEDRRVIDATIKRIEDAGTGAWMGYTYSWLSCMYARMGDHEKALKALHIFDDGFRYPNGFHTNGDISGKGYMALPFDCFTFEGNSLALAGIQDMFVQSRPGRLDLLMAWPEAWTSAQLKGFKADGAIEIVSLMVSDGRLVAKLLCANDASFELTVRGGEPRKVTLIGGEMQTVDVAL